MKIEIPTTLSKECITHFRNLYQNKYAINLNIEEANIEAIRILTFMAIVIENMENDYEN